ncbi:hypothetical protein MTO96_013541 [Rhipicephalus appendiculatus]
MQRSGDALWIFGIMGGVSLSAPHPGYKRPSPASRASRRECVGLFGPLERLSAANKAFSSRCVMRLGLSGVGPPLVPPGAGHIDRKWRRRSVNGPPEALHLRPASEVIVLESQPYQSAQSGTDVARVAVPLTARLPIGSSRRRRRVSS